MHAMGRYRLGPALRRRSWGAVHKGVEPESERPVAVEVLPKASFKGWELASIAAHFVTAVEAAARLEHPHILPVRDYGETDDAFFVVADDIEATPLADMLVAGGSLPPGLGLSYVTQVLAALQHAHQHGVVHGALTPAAIVVAGGDDVRVTDFWLGRLVDRRAPGDAAYQAPEQLAGAAAEPATDVFAVGVLLYRILTGAMPFTGRGEALARAVREGVPPAPSQVNGTLPPRLDPVIMRALAKRPGERYPSAEAFRANLQAAAPDLLKQRVHSAAGGSGLQRRSFAPGQTVFEEGDPGDCAFLIESGAVQIVKRGRTGPVVLATLGKGEIFGEMALVDDQPRMAGAVAAQRASLVVIPRDEFQARLGRVDKVTHKLLNVLVGRVRAVAEDLADLRGLME